MKNKKSKKILVFLFYFLLPLLFMKIDYRFIETFNCCQDDHDYYSHAETIAIDFDLNYDNQFLGFETERYNNNGKVAPKGFIGTGIFSSPFLFIGNFFESLFNFSNNVFNLRIAIYSLSSIFYFYFTIYLMTKVFDILNIRFSPNLLFVIFFGSGISYFAFERFSMSHIYEAFSITLIIYLSVNFYKKTGDSKNYYSFLIPLATFLSFSVRWVNYFIFFIPLIIKLLFNEKLLSNNQILKNKYFYASYGISILLFQYLNYLTYGIVTFNPQDIYGKSNRLSLFLNNDFGMLFNKVANSIYVILFSPEFGIFWFSPIIFYSLFLLTRYIFEKKYRNKSLQYIFVLFMYLIPFGIVTIWQSTASSYGFRYLYSLVPISILIFSKYYESNNKGLFSKYVFFFSIFSMLSILFFETSNNTSLRNNINSFGSDDRFSQPEYLFGLFGSFGDINSYLKIFVTSFVGVIIFKIFSILFGMDKLLEYLDTFGLPIDNLDFQNFVYQIQNIDLIKIIIFMFLFFLIIFGFYKQNKNRNFVLKLK
tara:strand:- start:688 stop:2292 length:1605 start_codon:yes stop_codon:yes gene_type:complete